jgi:hypothetical protein
LSIRKSTKKKGEKQVVDMENLAKIISIATIYDVLVEKESLLNKKSINYKETNSQTIYQFLA